MPNSNKHSRINSKTVKAWLEDPITMLLIERLKESKEYSMIGLSNEVLYTSDNDMLSQKTMGKLLGHKAQVQVIETILDLETFLLEEEVLDEEIYTNSEQSDSESDKGLSEEGTDSSNR